MPYTVCMREGTTAHLTTSRTSPNQVALSRLQALKLCHKEGASSADKWGARQCRRVKSTPLGVITHYRQPVRVPPAPSFSGSERSHDHLGRPQRMHQNHPTNGQTHATHRHSVRRNRGRLAAGRPSQCEGRRSASGNVTGTDQPEQALPHRSVSA